MRTSVLTIDWSPDALAQGDRMVAAREARYAALLRACGEQGCGHLLLGHHAGDQAETFLLRLLHASGVAGLACMPAVAQKRSGGGEERASGGWL
jgi:tRNA(Ile)-lysidine synthase